MNVQSRATRRSYIIRPLREGDLRFIADNLRTADAVELRAIYGDLNFMPRLQFSVDSSAEVFVAEAGGQPFAVFGIAIVADRTGILWSCGTSAVSRFSRQIIEDGTMYVRGCFRKWPSLETLICASHESNRVHHRWLTAIGAERCAAIALPDTGERFIPFLIKDAAHV